MTKVCFILFVNIAPAQYISKATLDKPCKLDSINLGSFISNSFSS